MDKNLNLRLEAIKLREENRQNPSDINHNKILYNPLPRVREIKAKIKKMGLIILQSFCTTKESIVSKIS